MSAKSRMITNNRLQISKLQVSHQKMTTETENKKRKDVAGTQLSIVKGLLNYSILKFWQKKLFENESQLVKDVAVSFC